MSTSPQTSAVIIPFPRFGTRTTAISASVRDTRLPRPMPTIAGSGWYHDAAIAEAEADRKS